MLDMAGLRRRLACQIGQGPRRAQHAIHPARRKVAELELIVRRQLDHPREIPAGA